MNKVIIIFGGSDGIGLSCARKLAKDNCVYNCSRRTAENENIRNLTVDVSNPYEIEGAFQTVIEAEGRIDQVIYSAGFSMAAPIADVRSEDYRYLFDVNFFGAIEVIKHCTKLMLNKNGRIVVVSSLGGVVPIAYDPYYSASKAALNMLVETLQLELRKRKIYLTSVLPGGTKTDFSFKRKIYSLKNDNPFAVDMQKAVSSLQTTEQSGMSPDAVADTIICALESNCPPILVNSGFVNKAFYAVAKLFPKKLLYLVCKLKYLS